MEIKKIIGKVFAAVAIGFALMVLYTNAFPLKIKTGTEWVESDTYSCGNAVIDDYIVINQEMKTTVRETSKDLAAKYPKQFKFDEETDTLYYAKERYICWKGFEISYN